MRDAIDHHASHAVKSRPGAPAGLDFTFPDQFETRVDAATSAMGTRFEIRRFSWRERSEIIFEPPCSYFELTHFPAVGRYLSAATADLVEQGEVRFYPAARRFHTRWRQSEQKSLFCRIDIPAITGMPMRVGDDRLCDTIDLRNAHVRALLMRAARELTAPGLCSQLVLDSISVALAAEMVQQFAADGPSRPARGGRLDPAYLRRLAVRLREEPGRLNVTILAAEAGVSPRHFERLFRAAAGESPAAFCRRHLLALARDLLADRALLVKEVAYRCGFASTASFGVAFRQMAGCSPQRYRDGLSAH